MEVRVGGCGERGEEYWVSQFGNDGRFLGSVGIRSVNWADLICIQEMDGGLGWTRLTDLQLAGGARLD